MKDRLITHFGIDLPAETRFRYYNYIEDYISTHVTEWTSAPNTDKISQDFASRIREFSNQEFAFLLSHTGYIPELYTHDSSQETLYSKLIEVLVCEWAVRVGFSDSTIQRQKASKEDVTIQIGSTVIVCDTKSYRLGRSQAAPNVKDAIKKADYEKWQGQWAKAIYKDGAEKYNPVGGLIAFPSLHRWKGKSDAYLYSTDKERPIVIMFFEHLAFFLLREYSHQKLIDLILSYPDLFPTPSRDQHTYFETILNFLFGDRWDEYFEYTKLFAEIAAEKVHNTVGKVEAHIDTAKKRIELEISTTDADKLKQLLIDARLHAENGQLLKQLDNIEKFRPRSI